MECVIKEDVIHVELCHTDEVYVASFTYLLSKLNQAFIKSYACKADGEESLKINIFCGL